MLEGFARQLAENHPGAAAACLKGLSVTVA